MTPDGECIPLFTGDPFLSFKQRLNIRFKSAASDNKMADVSPLMAGKIAYTDRYRRPTRLAPVESSVQFNTSLNLTRFVQAQSLRLRTRIDRRPHLITQLLLAISADPTWFKEEQPLVRATNLIVGPWNKYSFATSRTATSHFARYLRLVDGTLDRALEMSVPENVQSPIREKYYSLQEIEFYWEFDCDSPISFVMNALPKIRSMTSRFYEGGVSVQSLDMSPLETEHQSPSIKAKIGKGTWVRVYAKTTRRVRIEVVLEASIIGQKAGGQTASTRKQMCAKLDALSMYATSKLNPVLAALHEPPHAPSTISAMRLLSEVNRCSPSTFLAEAIIGALVAFDRVSLEPNSPFKEAVHLLRDSDVLRTVIPRSRNYTVTDTYRPALEQLKRSLAP